MQEKKATIRQVSELLGISADAIRLYEKEGLVQPERDEKNGYRYFRQEQIHRILGIGLYRKIGMGISDIREVLKIDRFDS